MCLIFVCKVTHTYIDYGALDTLTMKHDTCKIIPSSTLKNVLGTFLYF